MISDSKDWGTMQKTQREGILVLFEIPIQWNFPYMNIIPA